ncbi:MRPL40 [Auxenochlorella protothecoides x Auxenochlorella symbiontica]
MTVSTSCTALGRSITSLARFQLDSAACWSLQQVAHYAKASGGSGGGGHAQRTNRLLKVLEPQQTTAVARSLEELEDARQRSREYSRLKMRQHCAWQADLSGKLKLKQAALAALPDHLRAAAEVPDLSLFPLNRNVWRETPPAEAKVVKAAAHTSRTRNIGTKRQG